MIAGIGVDIVDRERITPLNIKLAKKILTEDEFIQLEKMKTDSAKIEFFGGRFAAKEAFSKAFGTGFVNLSFRDIEILADERGKPILTYVENQNLQTHVSISHSEKTIVAFVVLEKGVK